MMVHRIRRAIGALVVPLLAVSGASAQEAMYTAAATMPSRGATVVREQFMVSRFGSNPVSGVEQTTNYEIHTSIAHGLARGLALTLDVPVVFRTDEYAPPRGDDHDKGVSDLDLTFKYRVYKDDTGGVDTLRLAVMGGAYFASGDDSDFSTMSVDPHIGAVLTVVRGRHGFNQEFSFRLNTGGDEDTNFGGEGPSDALRSNTAYLYRVFPDRFRADSTGAWYVTAEINTLYETNGDWDLRWSPGLMYEGQRWGLEFMAQLPLYQDVTHRAEIDWNVGVGLRFLF